MREGGRERESPVEGWHVPALVAIHDPGHDGVGVGAGADDQEDHQEEGLEVEQGRLLKC